MLFNQTLGGQADVRHAIKMSVVRVVEKADRKLSKLFSESFLVRCDLLCIVLVFIGNMHSVLPSPEMQWTDDCACALDPGDVSFGIDPR